MYCAAWNVLHTLEIWLVANFSLLTYSCAFSFCYFILTVDGNWKYPQRGGNNAGQVKLHVNLLPIYSLRVDKRVATADWVMKMPNKDENDKYDFQFYSPAISPSFLPQSPAQSASSPSPMASEITLVLICQCHLPLLKRNAHHYNASNVQDTNLTLTILMITKCTIWTNIQGSSHAKIVGNCTKVIII